MRPYPFLAVGLLVAGLEEFITQGVLKDDLGGWVVPTIIAFTPFLMVFLVIERTLSRRLGPVPAALVYYLAAGTMGLLFEWFAMGLAPWTKPSLLQIPFQLGMFSFWSTVAFAPRILLDQREQASAIRKAFLRFLIVGFASIYALAFTVPRESRFGVVLAAVVLVFTSFNGFHFAYLWALQPHAKSENPTVIS